MKAIDRKILLPNVRIRSGTSGGSGTVVYSKECATGGFSTYILTNEHVVDNNIKPEKKWSQLLKRDIKEMVFGITEVHFFEWEYESRSVGSTSIDADIVTFDKDEDLALIKLRGSRAAPAVASLYPQGKENELRLGTPVVAIGAALGEAPVITSGRLSQFARDIEQHEYWIQTGPTIFGNSGGAVYLEETGEFIGVPARIAVVLMGFGADAITHLSFIVPITRVYKFLDEQLFRFIYDPQFTEEGEAKEREKRRKEEEHKIAIAERKGVERPEEE